MAVHVDALLPPRPISVIDMDAMVRAGILARDYAEIQHVAEDASVTALALPLTVPVAALL